MIGTRAAAGCNRACPGQALAEVRARIDCQELLPQITAMEAAFAFFSGDVRTALDLGFALSTSDVQRVVGMWVTTWMCWALALTGRFGEVRRVADAGRPAAFDHPGPYRFAMGLAEVVELTAAGDMPAAERVWERHAPTTRAWPAQEAFLHAMLG